MASARTGDFGLVVAAGRGRRFGCLKQFALLEGKPLIAYSLAAFERSSLVRAVVVVTNRTRTGYVRKLVRQLGLRKVLAVVAGGPSRSDSVRNGLALLPEQGYVAVHDAARPLVTARMIDQGLRLCRRVGPATFGYPLSDTVKQVEKDRIIATLERAGLFAVQTPQFFPVALLRKAHNAAAGKRINAPDDCALVELLGLKPMIIPGPLTNLKVTTRQDMALARRLL